MTQAKKLLERILRGDADANIGFGEMLSALKKMGFQERIKGDHHIFSKDGVEEIINLQPKAAKAKAYQVKQVRILILKYKLAGTL